MKKISIIGVWFISVCLTFFVGTQFSPLRANQYFMKDMAFSLVASFDWKVQNLDDVQEYQLSKNEFYEMYRHLTNDVPTNGNIEGISPNDVLSLTDTEQVLYVYEIPLEYDMPESTRLQSIIAFYNGKLCMSAIHVELENIEAVENMENQKNSTILPLTWSLNVNPSIIQNWRQSFLELMQ